MIKYKNKVLHFLLIAFLITSCKSDSEKANEYYENFEFDDAIEFYEKAILEKPNDFQINFRLISSYLRVGKTEKAELLIKEKRLLKEDGYLKYLAPIYYDASSYRIFRNDFDNGIDFLEKGILYNESGLEPYLASLYKLSRAVLGFSIDIYNEHADTKAPIRTKEQIERLFSIISMYTDKYNERIVQDYFEYGRKRFFIRIQPDKGEFYLDKSVELDSNMRMKCAEVYYKYGEKLKLDGKSFEEYNYYFNKAQSLNSHASSGLQPEHKE